MTTTIRGTPSLTVAPTQNTAPVFEFRCLYTHDLRKKKKIWHDGSLRFHTFNRRVMVYDDSKNYIGDAHWRETGDFQEGEELKLDKGVMVEVGEQIGHTETDLAPIILDRRRTEIASSPPRLPPASKTYSSWARPANSTSQARPKSLAAVLGASQGPIGRARFPTRSPFEQRQDNVQRRPGASGEPPQKMPRVVTEKENDLHNLSHTRLAQLQEGWLSGTAIVSGIRLGPHVQPSLVHHRPSEGSEHSLIPPPSVPPRLNSKEHGRNHLENVPVGENMQSAIAPIGVSRTRSVQKMARSHVVSPEIPDNTSRQNTSPSRASVNTRNTTGSKASGGKRPASERSSESTVTNKLRFAKDKPRKKLIYKDLLPHIRQERNLSGTIDNRKAQKRDQGQERQAPEQSKDLAESVAEDGPIIDLVSDDDVSQTAAQTPVRRPIGRIGQEILNPSSSAVRSPSPLFVRQSPRSAGLIASQQSFDEEFEPPPRSKSPSQGDIYHGERTQVLQKPQGDSLESMTESRDVGAAGSEPLAAAIVNAAPSNLTLLDQRLASERSIEQTPKQKRFRRILSEGDSHSQHQKEVHLAGGQNVAANVNARPGFQGPDPLQKPFRSPMKIQRSVSDITHPAQRSGMIDKSAPVPAAVEANFDPWSESEAYLLFDWWPPGRRKPCFDVNETSHEDSSEET